MSKVVPINKRRSARSRSRIKRVLIGALKILAIVFVVAISIVLISPALLDQSESLQDMANSVSNPNYPMLLMLRFVVYAASIWFMPIILLKRHKNSTPEFLRSIRISAGLIAAFFEVMLVQGVLATLIDMVI